MKICVFCMEEVEDFACPRCHEYKGIEAAFKCPKCGTIRPLSDMANPCEECRHTTKLAAKPGTDLIAYVHEDGTVSFRPMIAINREPFTTLEGLTTHALNDGQALKWVSHRLDRLIVTTKASCLEDVTRIPHRYIFVYRGEGCWECLSRDNTVLSA